MRSVATHNMKTNLLLFLFVITYDNVRSSYYGSSKNKNSFDSERRLSEEEKTILILKALDAALAESSNNFFYSKPIIENSGVFKFVKKLPNINLYTCDKNGTVRLPGFLNKTNSVCDLKLPNNCRSNNFLGRNKSLVIENPTSEYPDTEFFYQAWEEFNNDFKTSSDFGKMFDSEREDDVLDFLPNVLSYFQNFDNNFLGDELGRISNQVLKLVNDLKDHPGFDSSFLKTKELGRDWLSLMEMVQNNEDLMYFKQLTSKSSVLNDDDPYLWQYYQEFYSPWDDFIETVLTE